MNTYDPEDDIPASNWLGAYVNVIWNEYQEYWELTGHVKKPQFSDDERAVHRKLNSLGESLRSCLLSLAVSPEARAQVRAFLDHFGIKVDELDSAKVMRALHSKAIVRDAVLFSLAFEATDGLLPSAEKRATRSAAPWWR